MSGASRVAVVTGGNKGIGLAIVKDLCKKFDGKVYLTARDEGRGMEAVEKLKKEGLSPSFHQLDLDSQESVDKLKDYLKDKYGGLDVLVNNAGIAFKGSATEPQHVQAEVTMRTNYFGTLRVCQALFPLLKPHARVVNLSSMVGFLGRVPNAELRKRFAADDLTVEQLTALVQEYIDATKAGRDKEDGWMGSSYGMSKVAVSALSRIQQRQMDQDSRSGIFVNHVHPGYVDTDMTSHRGPLTVEQGAVSSVFAALIPKDAEGPKGQYLWHDASIVDWVNGPTP